MCSHLHSAKHVKNNEPLRKIEGENTFLDECVLSRATVLVPTNGGM